MGSGGGGGENAMLFLECEVNGRALRAFVDTGAQVGAGVGVKCLCVRVCLLRGGGCSRFMCERWVVFQGPDTAREESRSNVPRRQRLVVV